MSKRALSLLLIFIFALAPAASAAPMPDGETVAAWLDDTVFVSSVVTPHDYLGAVKIGNLYWSGKDGGPADFFFDVFVVDDSAEELIIYNYTAERKRDFFSFADGFSKGGIALGYYDDETGGWVNDWTVRLTPTLGTIGDGTGENPFVYEFKKERGKWEPMFCYYPVYDGAYDEEALIEDFKYIGWVGCSAIVFTESELAGFKNGGTLPAVGGGKDLSEYLDLTELKALLSGEAAAPPVISAPSGKAAVPTASAVYLDGAAAAFEAYTIDGSNYFKLRDLAMALSTTGKRFEIGYDGDSKAVTLTSGAEYTPAGGEMAPGDGREKTASATSSKIYLDGAELDLTAYTINGNNFFRLRDLMRALDIYVGYDGAVKSIIIDTGRGYAEP